MTKLRPPVSFENALTRVAGVITWEKVGELASRSASTVRTWSDPDVQPLAGDALTLELALRLDVAYRGAGGQGAPMLHCFATRLEIDCLAAAPDCAAIAIAAGRAARESGDAVDALIAASLPDAGLAQLAETERELEEAAQAHAHALALVRARRQALQGISGPEVPPSAVEARPAAD